MSEQASTVGIIYPGHAAEDDYPGLEAVLAARPAPVPVRLPVVISTIGIDEHTPEALRETGAHRRLSEACTRLLAEHSPDALMWACTSGSFVFGWQGAQEQARRLTIETGLPASSTSLAFVRALGTLGIGRVAVAASYPAELAEHFRSFLAEAGIEVTGFTSHGIFTAGEVGHLGLAQMVQMVRSADSPEAEAVLVPDTAMHSLQRVEQLEEAVGKPVLTANQVTVWEGMRLAGHDLPQIPGLGRLLGPVQRSGPATV
ncbi:maleate cis-trans isomerase [Nesterenkonia sp.]|uniref:maleate cis-trans isomerase family protein n=1 Tax=Nesterenkonia sp. TaxID=704201 RepID=UPI00260B0664|nr:maleate cis-trans isomerase [Nesterenkonia sp.]